MESSVSSVIAVAEHLHGQIGPTLTRFPEGFLESKKGPIKATFPSPEDAPFREFLYQALKNNRPTLGTRLNELASAVKLERLKLMTISEHQWIADVRKVRDLLAHTSSHVTRRGGNGDSSLLDRVNSQTRAIVTILILKQMGIEEAALDRAAMALSAELKRFAIEGTNTRTGLRTQGHSP
ncbi:HEPN domain-containing protein [Arthrobacter sp. SA17]